MDVERQRRAGAGARAARTRTGVAALTSRRARRPPRDDPTARAAFRALSTAFAAATPWLLDIGSWLFGALIGFDLLMLAALLTVGPVDRAVLISTAAFAVGLPPEAGAFVLLRIVRDLETTKLEQVALQSLAEEGLESQLPAEFTDPTRAARRTRSALSVSYGLLLLGVASALVGLSATLWHMGWWIATSFLAVVVVSQVVVFAAIMRSPRASDTPGPAG